MLGIIIHEEYSLGKCKSKSRDAATGTDWGGGPGVSHARWYKLFGKESDNFLKSPHAACGPALVHARIPAEACSGIHTHTSCVRNQHWCSLGVCEQVCGRQTGGGVASEQSKGGHTSIHPTTWMALEITYWV